MLLLITFFLWQNIFFHFICLLEGYCVSGTSDSICLNSQLWKLKIVITITIETKDMKLVALWLLHNNYYNSIKTYLTVQIVL